MFFFKSSVSSDLRRSATDVSSQTFETWAACQEARLLPVMCLRCVHSKWMKQPHCAGIASRKRDVAIRATAKAFTR